MHRVMPSCGCVNVPSRSKKRFLNRITAAAPPLAYGRMLRHGHLLVRSSLRRRRHSRRQSPRRANSCSANAHRGLVLLPAPHHEVIVADAFDPLLDECVPFRDQESTRRRTSEVTRVNVHSPRSVPTRFRNSGSRVFRSADACHSRTSRMSTPFGISARTNAAKAAFRRSSSMTSLSTPRHTIPE